MSSFSAADDPALQLAGVGGPAVTPLAFMRQG
jgi:hypothetical protein